MLSVRDTGPTKRVGKVGGGCEGGLGLDAPWQTRGHLLQQPVVEHFANGDALAVAAVEISIEAPAELRVELFGAVHIRDGNDDDLELEVMFNNRAYYNDWEHQERLARQRGTPIERARIGMEIDNPAPDFATLARSFSWHAEGPITDAADIEKAVQRAAEYLQSTGKPALVDVVCQPK